MRVKEFSIKNYKPFQSLKLTFPEENGIILVHGDYCSGKTSLWQAFQWVVGVESFETIESRRNLLNIEVANNMDSSTSTIIEGYVVIDFCGETYRISRSAEASKLVDNRIKYKTSKTLTEKFNTKTQKWQKKREKLDAAFAYWFICFNSSIPNLDSIVDGYARLEKISNADFYSKRLLDRISRKAGLKPNNDALIQLKREKSTIESHISDCDDRISRIDDELQYYKDKLQELKIKKETCRPVEIEPIVQSSVFDVEMLKLRERILGIENTYKHYVKIKADLHNRYEMVTRNILDEKNIQSGIYKEALQYAYELNKWISEILTEKKTQAKQEVYMLYDEYANMMELQEHYRHIDENYLKSIDMSTEMEIIVSFGIEFACRYLYEKYRNENDDFGIVDEKMPFIIDGGFSWLAKFRLLKLEEYLDDMERQVIIFCNSRDIEFFEKDALETYEIKMNQEYTEASVIKQ